MDHLVLSHDWPDTGGKMAIRLVDKFPLHPWDEGSWRREYLVVEDQGFWEGKLQEGGNLVKVMRWSERKIAVKIYSCKIRELDRRSDKIIFIAMSVTNARSSSMQWEICCGTGNFGRGVAILYNVRSRVWNEDLQNCALCTQGDVMHWARSCKKKRGDGVRLTRSFELELVQRYLA